MPTEEEQAAALVAWLENEGPAEGLDREVIEGAIALDPSLAPPMTRGLDEVLSRIDATAEDGAEAPGGEVIELSVFRQRRTWLALAAALVLGLGLGQLVLAPGPSSDVHLTGGEGVESEAFLTALESVARPADYQADAVEPGAVEALTAALRASPDQLPNDGLPAGEAGRQLAAEATGALLAEGALEAVDTLLQAAPLGEGTSASASQLRWLRGKRALAAGDTATARAEWMAAKKANEARTAAP